MGAIREVKVNDIYELLDVAYAEGNVKLEVYLDRVLSKGLEWFGAGGLSVFLRDGDSNSFSLAACCGLLSNVPSDAKIVEGIGIAGLAIAEQKPRLLLDPTKESDLSSKGIERKATIGSSLIVPLFTRNAGAIGVLNVARASDAVTFGEADLESAEALGRQIALAVNNARAIVNANQRRLSLQNAIDSVGFGLIMIDAEGELADYSSESASILGADPSDHRTWHTYFEKISHNFRQPLLHAMERAKKGLSYRFRVVDDKNQKAYAVIVSPLQGGGAIVALNDITEHEKAREAIDRIQRLAEIGQMTASIAHEIRNPLAGIRSAASMILEDPQLATEFAVMIENESNKLNQLCTEFLDFAKPISLEFEPIKLGDIVRQVSERHQDEWKKAGVTLVLQISNDEPVLYADSLRIEQVLRNLLLNAIQASEEGGTVTISVSDQGVLSITDEGTGMSEEVKDMLFTPFFTTRATGTGLGLSMVRKIVEAHKARVHVESESGKGTTFELNFHSAEAA